jgi:hypothetical protein
VTHGTTYWSSCVDFFTKRMGISVLMDISYKGKNKHNSFFSNQNKCNSDGIAEKITSRSGCGSCQGNVLTILLFSTKLYEGEHS